MEPAVAPVLISADLPRSCVRQRTFTLVTGETTLFFQIIDLGRQFYVWIAAGSAKQGSLYYGIELPGKSPVVTALVPGGAGSDASSLAARLAKKLGKPVLVSCDLPSSAPILQAIAERRLLQELEAMGASAPQQTSSLA